MADPIDVMITSLVGDEVEHVDVPSAGLTVYRSDQGEAWVWERYENKAVILEVRTSLGTLIGQVEYHNNGRYEATYLNR